MPAGSAMGTPERQWPPQQQAGRGVLTRPATALPGGRGRGRGRSERDTEPAPDPPAFSSAVAVDGAAGGPPEADRAPPKEYHGRNLVCCGGAAVLGPNVGFCLLAMLLLIAPAVVMIVLVLPTLPMPAYIMGIVLLALPVLFLMKTATTDPGILPRSTTGPGIPVPPMTLWTSYTNRRVEKEITRLRRGLAEAETAGRNAEVARIKDALAELAPRHTARVMLWYCVKCKAYRSPRAKHCYVCENCVELFDHHCPYTGTCIGLWNYRYYLWFLTFTNIAAVYCAWSVLWFWILASKDANRTAWEYASDTSLIPSYIILGYLVVVSFFVAGLTFYHYYLVATGQTTREHRRFIYKNGVPYSRGCWGNFCAKFLGVDTSMDGIDALVKQALAEYYDVEMHAVR